MVKTLSRTDKIFNYVNISLLFFLAFVTAYPLIYVASMSVSDVFAIAKREIWLWPKGFSLDAYQLVLQKPDVWLSYYNTVWYVVVGTTINLFMTLLVSYPLSRRSFSLSGRLMLYMAFTMWFHGGLIPNFILVNKLGMYNTRWAIVVPDAIATWNVIITRTFFRHTIPDEIIESVKIDGGNDYQILWKIVIPLSSAILAVNILFYAVHHWNSFFDALIYLRDKKLHPLQLFLRSILIEQSGSMQDDASDIEADLLKEKLKYAIIIFAMAPILCAYPYLQKYFVKGVMMGSLKG